MIDRIHGGNCLKRKIIDFSVNTNPLGLPKGLAGTILRNTACIERYPDPSSERLKRRLAASHGVGPENIAVGNGSIELIHLLPRALKIKKALIVTPTFSEYEFAVRAGGSIPCFFNLREEDGFRVDCGALARRLPRHDAAFLCNPNNPTGAMLHGDDVLGLARRAKRAGGILIVDEAFIEFTEEPNSAALVSDAVKNGSSVIVRSLTKFFAMPGLRLGYVIAHKRTIEKIARLQYPWNINGPAQVAGEAVLADRAYMDRTRIFVAAQRRRLSNGLSPISGLKAYPSQANFILCRLQGASVRSSDELARRLLRGGICIRACGNFRGLDDRYFRVAVRRRADNDRLTDGVRKAIR